jgi:hypothetical protein
MTGLNRVGGQNWILSDICGFPHADSPWSLFAWRVNPKRDISRPRSTRASSTEKVLKHAKQPMLEIPSLAEESICSSPFSHYFRNGMGIRTEDNDGGRVFTLLDVLRHLKSIET